MGKDKSAADKKSIRKQKIFAVVEGELIEALKHWGHIMTHRGTNSIDKEIDALGDLSFLAWKAMKILNSGKK